MAKVGILLPPLWGSESTATGTFALTTTALKFPMTPGHEAVGLIAAVGRNVTSLSIGQRVVIDPIVTCHDCFFCRRGEPLYCENLKGHGGSCTFPLPSLPNMAPVPDFGSCGSGSRRSNSTRRHGRILRLPRQQSLPNPQPHRYGSRAC